MLEAASILVDKYARSSAVEFEWDDVKAAGNLKKDGIRFAGAVTVFRRRCDADDGGRRIKEERFVELGLGSMGRVLVVVYTLRGERIRIISARKATREERAQYETRRA